MPFRKKTDDDEPMSGPLPADDQPPLDPVQPGRRKKQISVIDRRLTGGGLFSLPSQEIPLKDPDMYGKWFNRAISESRFYVAEQQKGWIKVHTSDLASLDAVSGYTITPEGFISRGPRGEEMLFMMPREAFRRIQFAKAATNEKRVGTKEKRADLVANATAAAFGSEAGDYVHQTEIESWKGPDG